MLAFKCENGGLWINDVVEELNGTDDQEQSYIIIQIKTDRLIMHNRRHLYSTLIITKQYL